MSQLVAVQTLEPFIKANLTSAKVAFEDTEQRDETLPNMPLLEDGEDAFIHVNIDVNLKSSVTIGASMKRGVGAVAIAIHTLRYSGRKEQLQILDELDTLLNSKHVGNCRIYHGEKVGSYVIGKWRIHHILYNFDYNY